MYEFCLLWVNILNLFEPVHEISNNVVSATGKASDKPAHMRSLIRAFSSRLNILWVLSYWLNIICSFSAKKEAVQACLSQRLAKCHIVGNLVPRLICKNSGNWNQTNQDSTELVSEPWKKRKKFWLYRKAETGWFM